MSALTVFACESQPVVVSGLREIFQCCRDLKFLGAAPDPARALPWIARLQPDLILTDTAAGLETVLRLVREVRRLSPGSRILLWVSELAEEDSLRALQAGIRGIVRRKLPVATFLECVRSVAIGEIWLENSLVNLLASLQAREKEMAPRV